MIIQAKLSNNNALMTAMHNQLEQRYLVPSGLRHGIYLVYWVTPDQRPGSWSRTKNANKGNLEAELRIQASNISSDSVVRPYILDISRPAS